MFFCSHARRYPAGLVSRERYPLSVNRNALDIRHSACDIQISNSSLLLIALAYTIEVSCIEHMDRASGSQF